jgi:hypothetical protein
LRTTPALRREQIKLEVALINPLMQVKGFGASETKTAAEQARLLIEQAEALGEPPEDRLLWFSVLYSFWVANFVVFNGDVMRKLATQFLTMAEKQRATAPLMIGHGLMGVSLMSTGSSALAAAQAAPPIAAIVSPSVTARVAPTRAGRQGASGFRNFRSQRQGHDDERLKLGIKSSFG